MSSETSNRSSPNCKHVAVLAFDIMRLVILTGGIAPVLPVATRLFKKHSIATVELEDVVSAALQPNSPAFAAILKDFGGSVLRPDGSLNMKALLDAVNADPGDKQVFDDITRPYLAKSAITQILWRWVLRAHVIVIDSAVFFEDIIPGWFFNDIITVTCSPQNPFIGEFERSSESHDARVAASS